MDKSTHINFWYFVIALLIYALAQTWLEQARSVETIAYSEFQELLTNDELVEIAISDTNIRGTLRDPQSNGAQYIYTVRIDPQFANDLAKYDIKFTGVIKNNWAAQLLSWVLPAVIFVGIWLFFIRRLSERQGIGTLSLGKSKAKVYVEKDTKVTFADVAGVDEAKAELQEIVAFLQNPTEYSRLGAHIPKGILLVGPPGTGKTLLARAVAGEAAVPFYSISGAEFVEMFVGVGAARVRDLFDTARNSAPCIIFIDELDALGRARGVGPIMGGHDEKEQTLNQLLSELDGFDPHDGIVLLAATNRPEILDPALLRAGRFDRQVLVDRPDKEGRLQILQVHTKHILLSPDLDLTEVAALTPGFSGADIANLVNEAAILATRRNADHVNLDDFVQAVERIVAGLEKKNRLINPYEREVVAYHEMGHALVRIALPGVEMVQKVSIIPRGVESLGYNIQRPTEERYLMTESELMNKMAVLMGGRAAEMLVFNTLSTGAADDLRLATGIARMMVTRFGMNDKIGHVSYEQDSTTFLDPVNPYQTGARYSESTAAKIDEAVRELTQKALDTAAQILNRYRQVLDEYANKLRTHETLSAEQLPILNDDPPDQAQQQLADSTAQSNG